ncbi:MAG: hypothetical protein JXB15_08245 [Anaerolineales bacterium]|nr:hypothetical protein [Anaerolineales bacterium]
MNSPIIWIILPSLAALILYLLRRRERLVHTSGIILVLGLALLAWLLPINEPVSLGLPGSASFKIGASMIFFGRQFTLDETTRPLVILIYLGVGLWFGGGYAARVDRLFIPLGVAIAALLTAALAVQPILYAVLIIQIVAIVSIPLLAPPGKPIAHGVIRFISFQTMGVCFILFANWLLGVVQTDPEKANLTLLTTLLFGLGVALLAGIFPFHTWVPMLAEEAPPYATAFVFFVIPTAVSFVGLDYLNQLVDITDLRLLSNALRWSGILMVVISGLWAAFERHLGRIFGFAILTQIGMALLAVSLGFSDQPGSPGLRIFFAQLLPQGIGIAVWALALSILRDHLQGVDPLYRQVQGLAHRLPVTAGCLLLAIFSLAGLPLLANFPGNVALWSALIDESLSAAILSLFGCAMLFAAGLRTMAVLFTGLDEPSWKINEPAAPAMLMILGAAMLLILGLFPQWFIPMMSSLGQGFSP